MGTIKIVNGRLWDGEVFKDGDIYTDGKTILHVGEKISETADFVFDATGKIVSAGLVDLHVHMQGEFGIDAHMSCIPFGVTAAADGGAPIEKRERYEVCLVKNKVFVSAGCSAEGADFDNVLAGLQAFGPRVAGIKVYYDTTVCDAKDIKPLEQICDFAQQKGLKVMVHCSYAPVEISKIVEVMHAGDILTHAYHATGHHAAEDNFTCLRTAKEKGIVIDTGCAGHVHTDFGVFADAIRSGCIPDTISTDITKYSAYKRGGRYGMTLCMSMAQSLGMRQEDVFRAVTSAPAKALGQSHIWGYLKPGRGADIAVLEYTDAPFSLTDVRGNTVEEKKGYRCVLTIADGEVVYRD